MADCPYYPRSEDWLVYRAVEEGSRLLVAGLRGSGVSTLLERASRLTRARPILARAPGEAAKACRGSRVVADLGQDLDSALRLLGRCKGIVVGVSLDLDRLAELPSALSRVRAEVVVLKPLSPAEANDYLTMLGVRVEAEAAEEVVLRTGGFPRDVCRLAAHFKGRLLTARAVSRISREPPWLGRARESMGPRYWGLVRAAFALALTRSMAVELGIDPGEPWLEWSGGLAYLWGELAWLHPFAAGQLGHREASRIYKLARRHRIPGHVLFTMASTLYKLTGDKGYARDMLSYGAETFESYRDPWARARVASRLVRAAEALGDHRGVLEWIGRLASTAPGDVASPEVAEAVSMAKRAYEALRDPAAYSEALYSLARLAASRRMLEELDYVIDELEELADLAPEAEVRYLAALMLRDLALGDWLRASRLAPDLLASPAPKDSRRLAVIALIVARRGIPPAARLDPDLEGFKVFMEKGSDPGDPVGPLTALANAVSRAARGEKASLGDPVADRLLSALAEAAGGRVAGAARELEPLMRREGQYSPLAFAADMVTLAAEAAAGRWGGAQLARALAKSASVTGGPAAWIAEEMAGALEARDSQAALKAAEKAVALAILTAGFHELLDTEYAG